MAIHWKIPFKSLRTGTLYTVNIYDASFSGTPVVLKGGASPFSTEENEDEDQFAPIRTQSGSIRIIDDGKDASGNALATGWWKQMVPVNDTDRPVTLTDGSGNVVWQGFMQAQNFGAELYEPTQEREFPVQCCLSVLAATQVSTTEAQLCNFAYLLRYIFNSVPSHSFTSFVIQGGADAQQWLLKRIDWHNFLNDNADNDVEPKYNLYEILEDVCQFWGWTARIYKQTIYLTCADDTAETTFLTLTPANLDTMAAGGTAGTTSAGYSTATISGDVFASTDNSDYKQRGPNKATVKADVNKEEIIAQFAPASVRHALEANGWTWVQQSGEDLTGYFETNSVIGSFTSEILDGTSHDTRGGYSRRQIYSSKEADKPFEGDMFLINNTGYDATQFIQAPAISIVTKKAMAFSGGSIVLSGDVYFGAKPCDVSELPQMFIGVGISPDGNRANARWWYIRYLQTRVIDYGWSTAGDVRYFAAGVNAGKLKSCKLPLSNTDFDAIPIIGDLYGFVHVDIYGFLSGFNPIDQFQIANFAIEFSRDTIDIPTSPDVVRPRVVLVERVSTQNYTATNTNQTHEEWNADCIFASDNNMEYGYGLIMNANGSFMEKAQYGGVANSQHPEQHLANRVATYWASSRRKIIADFRTNTIPEVSPQYKLTIDGTQLHPIAISRDWRNDVVRLSMLEMP